MATKPFYGDPATSAPVFSKYAVLLGGLTATNPTGVPTGTELATMGFVLNDGTTVTDEWDPVGALDDASPMDDGEESITSTPHSAAGHGIYARTYRDQEERFTFTALESTLTTLGLIYDNSGLTEASGTISGTLGMRDPSKRYKLGLVRVNDSQLERKVTNNYAQIDTISRQFTDGKRLCTVTVSVYPDADGDLWDYYLGPKE